MQARKWLRLGHFRAQHREIVRCTQAQATPAKRTLLRARLPEGWKAVSATVDGRPPTGHFNSAVFGFLFGHPHLPSTAEAPLNDTAVGQREAE